MNFTIGTFDAYAKELDRVTHWLSELGINVQPSRIGTYRKSFNNLLAVSKTKNESLAKEKFTEFKNTLYEIHELMNIYEGFRHKNTTKQFLACLKSVVSGPVDYGAEDESSSNKARNTAFELIVASRLICGGLNAGPTAKIDIECHVGGHKLFFECKRPQMETTILRRVKEANSQLKKLYKQERSSPIRGIIAVDLSKSLVPADRFLVYESEVDIERVLNGVIDDFQNKIGAQIDSLRHRKTIGIVIRVSVMAAPKDPAERLVYCEQYGFMTFNSSSNQDKKLAVKIGEALRFQDAA